MATSLVSDIFKFVALRPPQNFEYEKDLINIIRDNRIRDSYVPGEIHTPAADEAKFTNSPMATKIFEKVKQKIGMTPTDLSVIALSDQIADELPYDLKNERALDEKTKLTWLYEFSDVIKRHLKNFDKRRLLEELDAVVTKNFPELNGLRDYVEINTYANDTSIKPASRFCEDFDILFDHLYLLYVCKRRYPINLEYTIDALRALHVIRFLALEMRQEPVHPSINLQGCLYIVVSLLRRLSVRSLNNDKRQIFPVQDPLQTRTRVRTECAFEEFANFPKVPISSKEQLAALFDATPFIHQFFACLVSYYIPFNDIKPIGIGDLLVTKQFLCKYEAGEVAHVENVLKGESKERSHRRLDRTEDLFSRETENTEETERELQTTDRYELKTETEATIQDDLKGEIAASVSGKYGMVEYSANTGLSYSRSTSDSRRTTNNFAKDIVDRSLIRIQKRVREERATKKIYEVEEINKHGLNNTSGGGHITGIYRWLNKHYKAQVYNYGKRLMFEFIVPEPAAFIQFAFEHNKEKLNKPDKPQKPAFPALNISQISDATLNTYAALYDINDLEPEPKDLERSVAVQADKPDNKEVYGREYFIEVPQGYEAYIAKITGGIKFNDTAGDVFDWVNYLFLSIGGLSVDLNPGSTNTPTRSAVKIDLDYIINFAGITIPRDIGSITNRVPIAILAQDVLSFGLTVTVKMRPSDETKQKWRLETYRRIMDAYQKLVTEYEAALSDYEDKLEGYEVSKGVIIEGRNPLINQDIIKTELKKHCITMIAKQFDTVTNDDITFDAMQFRTEKIDQETSVVTETKKVTVTTPEKDKTVTVTETTFSETTSTSSTDINIPAIDIYAAREQGKIIQFLEQAFEWPQISYLLYPYFWGEMPEKWLEAQAYYDEVDPLYAKFLQAGSARVLIAVRPAYEMVVMHYLCTGKPWNGGPAPGLNNPLYIPIHEELRNQQDDLNGAEPYGEAWEVVVPTSLVYLQGDATLPTYECESKGAS